MEIIVGCIVEKDNKILMVKEAKEMCYGQWNFPAEHLEENENIKEAAIREFFEETGCKAKLTGVLPIQHKFVNDENLIMIRFIAEIEDENIKYNEKEIIDVKWIDIEEIKNMKKSELRGYEMSLNFLEDYEKKLFILWIFLKVKDSYKKNYKFIKENLSLFITRKYHLRVPI